jgi:hypothetical protein
VTVPAFYHLVLRWENDNPGIWAMHCHVAWHVEGGMLFQFAERLGDFMDLLDGMDGATRKTSLGFCGVNDDQALRTYGM